MMSILQEKIKEIEKEMNDYLLLWGETDSRTERARKDWSMR